MTDRLVRVNSSRATGTNASVTFSEGTPLDDTHLLVAVVSWGSTIALSAPAGWTEAPGGGSSTSNIQVRIYARQGNGSVNNFSMTGPSAAKTVYLMAFSGFVSATASAGQGGNLSTGTTYTVPDLVTDPAVEGVAIAAVGTVSNGDGTWGSYTLTGSYPSGGTVHPGRKVYTGAGDWGDVYSPGLLGAARYNLVVYELV